MRKKLGVDLRGNLPVMEPKESYFFHDRDMEYFGITVGADPMLVEVEAVALLQNCGKGLLLTDAQQKQLQGEEVHNDMGEKGPVSAEEGQAVAVSEPAEEGQEVSETVPTEAEVFAPVVDADLTGLHEEILVENIVVETDAAEEDQEVLKAVLPITKELPKLLLPTPQAGVARVEEKTVRCKAKGKENAEAGKNGPSDSMRKSLRLANKPKTNLTMEEQATQLLMKKCGVLEPDQVAEEKHHGKFRAQFVDPLQIDTVGGMREMFGLNSEGVDGPDLLGSVALDAED